MAAAGWLRRQFWSRWTTPATERELFQTIAQLKPVSILEIALADLQRTQKMLQHASRATGASSADRRRHVIVDLFDARPPKLPIVRLKEVHRTLSEQNVTVQLVPGDPPAALATSANSLGQFDLIVIHLSDAAEQLRDGWYFLPRLMHSTTEVLEQTADGHYRKLTPLELQQRIRSAKTLRRRAA